MNRSHRDPLRALQFSEVNRGSLLSVDSRGVACVWDTPSMQCVPRPLLPRLCIAETPSQVLFAGDFLSPTLAAAWISQLDAVATASGEGVVRLFHVGASCPSAAFANGAVRPLGETDGVAKSRCNGPFDAAPKPP